MNGQQTAPSDEYNYAYPDYTYYPEGFFGGPAPSFGFGFGHGHDYHEHGSNTAGMNTEAGEPGMVTPVMTVDTTGKAYGHFRWFPPIREVVVATFSRVRPSNSSPRLIGLFLRKYHTSAGSNFGLLQRSMPSH